MGQTLTLEAARKGQRVLHKTHKRTGVVVRPVKSRRVITITWDDNGAYYDAYPHLLDLIEGD